MSQANLELPAAPPYATYRPAFESPEGLSERLDWQGLTMLGERVFDHELLRQPELSLPAEMELSSALDNQAIELIGILARPVL